MIHNQVSYIIKKIHNTNSFNENKCIQLFNDFITIWHSKSCVEYLFLTSFNFSLKNLLLYDPYLTPFQQLLHLHQNPPKILSQHLKPTSILVVINSLNISKFIWSCMILWNSHAFIHYVISMQSPLNIQLNFT